MSAFFVVLSACAATTEIHTLDRFIISAERRLREKIINWTMLPDLSELVIALSVGNFPRIAVQLYDSDLILSSEIVDFLQKSLPGANVSVLGDSVTQCCLDEISAEHYGSDCIVKLGHSCWFASQRIPAYFVTCNTASVSEIIRTSWSVRERNSSSRIVIFVESAEQMQQLQVAHAEFGDNLFICVTTAVSFPGSNKRAVNWLGFGPFSSIAIRSIGLLKQRITPDYPRVCGRIIFRSIAGKYKQVLDNREVNLLVDDPDTVFIVTKEGTLYERLMNRFGSNEGRVHSCSPAKSSDILRTNYTELLRRYRGVESVKNSAVIGIVVMHSAACKELFRVRDILSRFLRSAGKEVHMFSVSKLDGVKLGNFPEIDCFVVMNCPESEYFESSDLQASCVSPFEALVAMDSLEWGDHIITDYDEMLQKMVMDPPPRTPRTPRSTRPEKEQVTSFQDVAASNKLEPAKIEMGLRGIPSRYVSEPLAR